MFSTWSDPEEIIKSKFSGNGIRGKAYYSRKWEKFTTKSLKQDNVKKYNFPKRRSRIVQSKYIE